MLGAAASALPVFGTTAEASTLDPSRTGSMLDKISSRIEPAINIRNAHTGEEDYIIFFQGGRYSKSAISRLNHLFRDWRQDEEKPVDIRIFWGLAALRAGAMQAGLSGQINLNSGYRSPTTNNLLRRKGYGVAKNSFHLKARASDITIAGAKVEDTTRYAKFLQIGGVGHYPGRFTHIDTGNVRSWVTR